MWILSIYNGIFSAWKLSIDIYNWESFSSFLLLLENGISILWNCCYISLENAICFIAKKTCCVSLMYFLVDCKSFLCYIFSLEFLLESMSMSYWKFDLWVLNILWKKVFKWKGILRISEQYYVFLWKKIALWKNYSI